MIVFCCVLPASNKARDDDDDDDDVFFMHLLFLGWTNSHRPSQHCAAANHFIC